MGQQEGLQELSNTELSEPLIKSVSVLGEDAKQRAWRMDNYESMSFQDVAMCATALAMQGIEVFIETCRIVDFLYEKLTEESSLSRQKRLETVRRYMLDMEVGHDDFGTFSRMFNVHELRLRLIVWDMFDVAMGRGLISKPSEALTLFPNVKEEGYYRAMTIPPSPDKRLGAMMLLDQGLGKIKRGEPLSVDDDLPRHVLANSRQFRHHLQRLYFKKRKKKGPREKIHYPIFVPLQKLLADVMDLEDMLSASQDGDNSEEQVTFFVNKLDMLQKRLGMMRDKAQREGLEPLCTTSHG